MNRVFICGAFNFPRGGASSNYVQYFGMALKECGYEVHVVTTRNKDYHENSFKGLHIDEVEYRSGKLKHYYDFKTGAKKAVLDCLKTYQVGKGDTVIVYSHNLWLHEGIQAWCRRKGIKVGAVVVEYFSKQQFDSNLDYQQYNKLTKKVLPKYDFIFPISTYIEKKLSDGRARQLVLPIMADPYEYEYKEKPIDGTRKFIFPAKGKMKDALENMILAIDEILRDPYVDVEFHFCGVKERAIREIIQIPGTQKIDRRIILHGWLDYCDLVKLYQKMHFLLLARDTNEMTKANFPSKVPELLCYGVIPIASEVGDYTDYYLKDEENSLLISGCNVETIENAIIRAIQLKDKDLRMLSNNARRTACELLSYPVWVTRIKEFLENIE